MIKALLNQLVKSGALKGASKGWNEMLNSYELQPGELRPMMVLAPDGDAIKINIVTLKTVEGESRVFYSRLIETMDLAELLAGKDE